MIQVFIDALKAVISDLPYKVYYDNRFINDWHLIKNKQYPLMWISQCNPIFRPEIQPSALATLNIEGFIVTQEIKKNDTIEDINNNLQQAQNIFIDIFKRLKTQPNIQLTSNVTATAIRGINNDNITGFRFTFTSDINGQWDC